MAGQLSSPPSSILELVNALHPTPAVGGDPQTEALTIIKRVEGIDRRRYAGPVGWVAADGDGEFAVGIRSVEVSKHGSLFAGVGLVEDSDPQSELEETEAKFKQCSILFFQRRKCGVSSFQLRSFVLPLTNSHNSCDQWS